MSRFSNLEFEGARKASEPAPAGEPVRDKLFFHERALTAWLAGQFEEALQNHSRSLEDDSSFFGGWFGQVRMLLEMGEYPEAATWADKAMELFPAQSDLLAAKATALLRQSMLAEAQALSDKAIARERVSHHVWLGRAEIMLRRQHATALVCIRTGLAAAGAERTLARLEAGRLLSRAGRHAEALEHLKEAAQDLATSALAWFELGACQHALGFKDAAMSLTQCLHLRPHYAEASELLRRSRSRGFFAWLRRSSRS
jgi:tetratricopeptide (TPR) repeat protein